ncbi:hypothetical protein TNCV_1691611 [Trichonephila clavipes]|nr:hypothetical protein TNCV_1691611 [Trichonephila clavipes]
MMRSLSDAFKKYYPWGLGYFLIYNMPWYLSGMFLLCPPRPLDLTLRFQRGKESFKQSRMHVIEIIRHLKEGIVLKNRRRREREKKFNSPAKR